MYEILHPRNCCEFWQQVALCEDRNVNTHGAHIIRTAHVTCYRIDALFH